LEYRLNTGSYPPSLAALFPTFAPVDDSGRPRPEPPVDPVTGSPYEYAPVGGGAEYVLTTVLSNERRFEGFPHKTPS
jgi:hypothetical protein